jgi:hypothetical protein
MQFAMFNKESSIKEYQQSAGFCESCCGRVVAKALEKRRGRAALQRRVKFADKRGL